jgi:hypothetical protein
MIGFLLACILRHCIKLHGSARELLGLHGSSGRCDSGDFQTETELLSDEDAKTPLISAVYTAATAQDT